jgi:LacI family transcriptional regulator
MPDRSTITDVAAEAGVSISTVSLVMNGKGPVADSTRARVEETASRLGYTPSRTARRLGVQRTDNVGFVLREDHFLRSEPFYTRVFLGAEFEARRRNLYVLLSTIPERYDPKLDAPRFLHEHSVDGVLVAGGVDPAFLEALSSRRIPFILADFRWQDAPHVMIDNEGGARAVAEHFVERGHTRTAVLGADLAHPSPRARLDAFCQSMAESGHPLSEAYAFTGPGPSDRANGYLLAERITTMPAAERPTAVFCANDALALGLLDRAREAGLRVPDDLAIAGFDDVEGAAAAHPSLTTVRVFKEQLGEVALRTLADLVEHKGAPHRFDRGASTTHISTELVVRDSS